MGLESRLSMCTNVYTNYPLNEAVKRIRWLGYPGIEIWGGGGVSATPHVSPTYMTAESILEVKATIQAEGLQVAAFCNDPRLINIASPDQNERKRSIEYLRKAVDCSAEIGSPTMVMVPGSGQFGQPRKEAWNFSREAIGIVCDYAKSRGVKIALEPMTRLESNFLLFLDDLLDMFKEVGASNLGCNLDVAHANVNHENLVDYKILGNRLFHVHISDNDGKYDSGLVLGEGTLYLEPFLRMLKQIDYKGYLSTEVGFAYLLDPDSAALRMHHALRSLLQAIED